MIVVSNRVQVPDERIGAFVDRLRKNHGIETQPGFRGLKLLSPIDAEGHVTMTFWDTREDYEAWRESISFKQAHDGTSAERAFEAPNVVEIHEVIVERSPAEHDADDGNGQQ